MLNDLVLCPLLIPFPYFQEAGKLITHVLLIQASEARDSLAKYSSASRILKSIYHDLRQTTEVSGQTNAYFQ